MLNNAVLGFLFILLTSLGCGKEKDDKNTGGQGAGCLQGMIVNGLTGERLAVPRANAGANVGVFVLRRNELLGGQPMVEDPNNEVQSRYLKGDYTLCGVPLDVTLPLLVWVDGYLPFSGLVSVPSTAASLTGGNPQDHLRVDDPIRLADVMLFPVGTEVKDFTVKVSKVDDGALENVRVYLKPSGNHVFSASGGNWVAASGTRPLALEATTNAKGEAVFSAGDLVLGGQYQYTVVPPDGAKDYQGTSGQIWIGLHTGALDHKPYLKEIVLTAH